MPKPTALVLAAGQSRRFGDDKRLAKLENGQSLLMATLQQAASICDDIYLVIRADDQVLRDHILPFSQGVGKITIPTHTAQIHWVVAEDAPLGMGHSLSEGVNALINHNIDQCLIFLGDMPYIQLETLKTIAAELDKTTFTIPRVDGHWGHPIGVRSEAFHLLTHLSGDRGAKAVLKRHIEMIQFIDVADQGILRDVDTPQALE